MFKKQTPDSLHAKDFAVDKGGEITVLLRAWSDGDQQAFADLLPLVLKELRRLARHHMRRSSECPTLQPTALVNEAYLRLVSSPVQGFDDRRQFFAFASKVLREVLVDYVRSRRAQKRGGGEILRPLEEASNVAVEIAVDKDAILSLHVALSKLEKLHQRQARIIELRFFGGLTLSEIARVLNWSDMTIRRDWEVARRWLRREMLTQHAGTG